MLSHRSIVHHAVLWVVACTLGLGALAGPAAATDRAAAARAQGRYYASFGQPQGAAVDKIAAALAQGRYYASFRHERPLTPPGSGSTSTGWLTPGVGLAIALLVAAAGTAQFRRSRMRRHVHVTA